MQFLLLLGFMIFFRFFGLDQSLLLMEYFSFSRLKYSFFGNIGILFGSVQCFAFNLLILSVSSFFKFCINDAKRDKLILKGENRLSFSYQFLKSNFITLRSKKSEKGLDARATF